MIWSSFGKKWVALPTASAAGAVVKSYFDTLYVALTGDQTVAGVKTFSSNPVVSGGGIQFPATQVPSADANALDDYEEGTFTPEFSASGSTFSYQFQNGRYVKIGKVVDFNILVGLNTSGNTLTANALSITGLPFANSSQARRYFANWIAATTSYVQVTGSLAASATTIAIQGLTAAAVSSATNLNANAILHATNGSQIRICGTYEAA